MESVVAMEPEEIVETTSVANVSVSNRVTSSRRVDVLLKEGSSEYEVKRCAKTNTLSEAKLGEVNRGAGTTAVSAEA